MNQSRLFLLFAAGCSVLFWLVLFGCDSVTMGESTFDATSTAIAQTETVVASRIETTIEATVTPARPTDTSTPAPTFTLLASTATHTATLTPPTVTPTITPVATLSVGEESTLLSELMTTNGDCTLPCWWHVVPGESTVQEVRDMFARKGIDKWSSDRENTYRQLFLGYEREGASQYLADIELRLYSDNGTVDTVYVRTGGYEWIGSPFLRDWQGLALSEVLAQHGTPSHVQFQVFPPSEPGPSRYLIAVSYPTSGIEIRYWLHAERLNETKDRVCADLERVRALELVLYAPNEVGSVPAPLINDPEQYTSWEDVTGMDNDAFYDALVHPADSPCVEVTRS